MNEETKRAIETPKNLRSQKQKEIIFGDCNPNRKIEGYRLRAEELVKRLENGEYLTNTDKREAKRYKKEGIL